MLKARAKTAYGRRVCKPRFSNVLVRLCCASLCFGLLSSTAPFAQTLSPIEAAFDVCANSKYAKNAEFEGLTQKGWQKIHTPERKHRDILVDGIIASMSTNRETPVDWATGQASAKDLGDTLLSGVTSGIVTLYAAEVSNRLSLLVAYDQNYNADFHRLHCIYAGTLSKGFSEYLDTLRRADMAAGIRQASNGLELYSLRTQSQTNDTPAKMAVFDAQYGLFQAAAERELNRAPAVEIGLSMFRYTQR